MIPVPRVAYRSSGTATASCGQTWLSLVKAFVTGTATGLTYDLGV